MPFSALMSIGALGPLRLKNRFVMSPIVTGMERNPNIPALRDFYIKRAQGGVSLIIISEAIVDSIGKRFSYERVFDEDLDIPRYRSIVKGLHDFECKAVLQLVHMGSGSRSLLPVGVDRMKSPTTGKTVLKAPSIKLASIVRHYAKVSKMARECGFDGIEILASGNSLIAEFLSPATNKRTDVWGRNQLARFKLALDVVRSVRKSLGPDKAIGFRLNLNELDQNAADWNEVKRLVQMLRMAGVDYLAAEFASRSQLIPKKNFETPPGAWFADYLALLQLNELPVLFGGRLADTDLLEAIAQANDSAFFEIGEPLLADPEIVRKIETNCTDSIQRCLHCYIGCVKKTDRPDDPIRCLINPWLFQQDRFFSNAPQKKNIAVVGSGICGLIFSINAARRGHKIHLYEQSSELGGQLKMMAKIPGRSALADWISRLEKELEQNGAVIHKETTASLQFFIGTRFDDYVVCTGSRATVPDIDGVDSSNVLTYEELLDAEEPVGNRVAVIGVNIVGIRVALYLTETSLNEQMTAQKWRNAWGIGDIQINKGGVLGFIPEIEAPTRKVFLLEEEEHKKTPPLTDDLKSDLRWLLMRGVQIYRNIQIDAMDNYSIRIHTKGQQHKDSLAERVNHVILCGLRKSNNELGYRLESAGLSVKKLGTCVEKHLDDQIDELIVQAENLALSI